MTPTLLKYFTLRNCLLLIIIAFFTSAIVLINALGKSPLPVMWAMVILTISAVVGMIGYAMLVSQSVKAWPTNTSTKRMLSVIIMVFILPMVLFVVWFPLQVASTL